MIRIEGLEKSYGSARRSVHVIEGIDLDIPAGCFFVLLGPSGSGKTTALRVVAGLERHEAGRVSLDGRIVSDPARGVFVHPSQRGIGMVFQSYAIWPHMTVFDNVAYPLEQGVHRSRDAIGAEVAASLALVGLSALAQRPATLLSGGQQQRVALARALVARPRVLLLDEPLSNLDAQLRERMRVEIREVQRSVGITALYVTHDRTEALSMADLVAVMNNGRIEMLGTPRDLYDRPATAFVAGFLGPANLLAGRIEAAGEGQARVATAIGSLQCRAHASAQVGSSAEVVFRPEDFVLSADAVAGATEGRIDMVSYLGDRLECAIRLQDTALRVTAHPGLELQPHSPVWISVVPGRGWVIPA